MKYLEVRKNHIFYAMNNPDKFQELKYYSKTLLLYSRLIKESKYPYILLIPAVPKSNDIIVEYVFKIYPTLPENIFDKNPLELLLLIVRYFGCKIIIGGKEAEYFMNESLLINNDELYGEHIKASSRDISNSNFLTHLGFYEIENCVQPIAHILLFIVINGEGYFEWASNNGNNPINILESELYINHVKTEVLPLSRDKEFIEKIYILVHDFCFYCKERPQALNRMSEENIRDLFLLAVKISIGTGESEAFHYDGKLDFKIVNPNNKYEIVTGEFKWWHGESSAIEVFNQAVRKHASGQEAIIYAIILNKTRDAGSVYDKIRNIFEKKEEIIPSTFISHVPIGSKELFGQYNLNIRGKITSICFAVADLYYKRI